MDDIFTKIPECIGVLPDNSLYHNYPKIYALYSMLHFIYNLGLIMYPVVISIIDIIHGLYPRKEISFEIMVAVKHILYALIVSISVLWQNLLYPRTYIDMKIQFRKIDAILVRRGISFDSRFAWIKYIIFYSGYILYVIYLYHIAGHDEHVVYIVLVSWIHYNFALEIVLAWRWLELIRQRLYYLNALIKDLELNSSKHSEQLDYVVSPEDVINHTGKYVNDLIEIQRRIVIIVNAFNVLMGTSVALRSFLFIIEILIVVLRITIHLPDGFLLSLIDTLIEGVNRILIYNYIVNKVFFLFFSLDGAQLS